MNENNLKKIRLRKNVSVERLAEMVGCSEQTIYKIQTGERDLSSDWLLKLSRALDCYPSELLPDAWQKPPQKSLLAVDQDVLARVLKRLLDDCAKPEVQKALLQLNKVPTPEFIAEWAAIKYNEAVENQTTDGAGLGDVVRMAGKLLSMKHETKL